MTNPILALFSLRRSLMIALMVALSGAAALAWKAHALRPQAYVLTLHAARSVGHLYYSAWNESAVVIADHDASDGREVVYTRTFTWKDGCTWESTETLTPDGEGYRYFYDEAFVSCPAGLSPRGGTSPHGGYVTVTAAGWQAPLTPRDSVATFGLRVDGSTYPE